TNFFPRLNGCGCAFAGTGAGNITFLDPLIPFGGTGFAVQFGVFGVFRDFERTFVAHEILVIATTRTGGRQHAVGGAHETGFGRVFVNRRGVVVPLVRFIIIGAAAGDDGARVHAQHPIEDIDLVSAQIGNRSTGVRFEPAP